MLTIALTLFFGPLFIGAVAIFVRRDLQEQNRFKERLLQEQKDHDERLVRRLFPLLTKHEAALTARLRQKLYRDPYGRLMTDKLGPEVDYFFKNVIEDEMRPASEADFNTLRLAYRIWLSDIDLEALLNQEAVTASSDGLAYERQVARQLAAAGFSVSFTPQSGDQGVDLLAECGGERIAIQCKNYARPVGNEAVQQVYAGARFYQAGRAAVVAPNGYTIAALQLATSLGVLCLSEHDVSNALNPATKETL